MSEHETDQETAGDKQTTVHEAFVGTIDSTDLHRFVAQLDAVTHEAVIEVSEDGLSTRAVDAANVAMVENNLDASRFEAYHLDVAINVGVGTGLYASVLERMDGDVDVRINPREGTLTLESDTYEFTGDYLDPENIRTVDTRVSINHEADFDVDSLELKRGVRACDEIADYTDITFDPDKDRACLSIESDAEQTQYLVGASVVRESAAVKSKFSNSFLKDIAAALHEHAVPAVSVKLGQEVPVVFSSSYAGGLGEVSYLLAPRIGGEE